MPIEHEHKFVLQGFDTLIENLKGAYIPSRLTQFYISDHARYRCIQRGPVCEHLFTYKIKIGQDVLEHEMSISEDDYRLAEKAALGFIHKLRFKFMGEVGEGAMWDVDFLYDENEQVYFGLAECEHVRGTTYSIPPVLRGHIAFGVPEADAHRFSNRKLINRDYTRGLVQEYLNDTRRAYRIDELPDDLAKAIMNAQAPNLPDYPY